MAPSTGHDLLRSIGQSGRSGLARVRRDGLRVMAEHRDETRATLDCDATFIPSKAGTAQKSYIGERGWMPMMAFWGELGVVVHEEFRHGNESPGGGALPFLKETLSQLPERVNRVYVRSDSAWYQAEVMDYCQDKGIGFSITADRDEAVKALIEKANGENAWDEFDAGSGSGRREWAHETVHTLNNSKHSYRLILLRREKKELDLFDGKYIYGAVITNMDKPLVPQLIWHRERCNCENHIKELKYGLPLSKLPSADFDVNAAFFRIMTLAWNLLAALKHFVLDESWRYLTLKTIRFRLLAMPALVIKHARQLWLKLPRGRPYAPILKQALA